MAIDKTHLEMLLSRFDSIDDKLAKQEANMDGVKSEISDINITLAKQEVSLREHMARTKIAEENILTLNQKIDEETKFMHKHINNAEGAMKLVGVLATIGTVIAGIVGIIKFFMAGK